MSIKRRVVLLLAIGCAISLLAGCGQTEIADESVEHLQKIEEEFGVELIEEVPAEQVAPAHPAAEAFAGGTGTAEDPYQIANAEQLQLLSDLSNSEEYTVRRDYCAAHYVLTADIVFNDISNFESWTGQAPAYSWNPIGMTESFSGIFDGNGHTISGLYICHSDLETDVSEYYRGGLFANVTGAGEGKAAIHNLTIAKSLYRVHNVTGHIGGIAGQVLYAGIENCHTDVVICCEAGYAMGGIAGSISNAVIADCTSSAAMEANHRMGTMAGIVAESYDSTISNCSFSGTITVKEQVYNLAGIVGSTDGGTIENCENNGMFQVTGEAGAGGIVAQITDDYESEKQEDGSYKAVRKLTTVSECVNNADISCGSGIVGEILALRSDIVISNCANNGDVCMSGIVGAIRAYGDEPEENPGFLSDTVIENCSNNGSVNGTEAAGGIIGLAALRQGAEMTIKECVNTASVESEDSVGGLIGSVVAYGEGNFSIVDSSNEGAVLGNDCGAGGAIGSVCFMYDISGQMVTLEGCTNYGGIRGTAYGVGGILGRQLGQHGGEGSSLVIRNCTNYAQITGTMANVFAGGIAGYLPANKESYLIENCVNNGNVLLSSDEVITVDGEFQNCPFGCAGGIVGGAQSVVEIKNCNNNGELFVEDRVQCKVLMDDIAAYIFEGSEPIFGFFGANS